MAGARALFPVRGVPTLAGVTHPNDVLRPCERMTNIASEVYLLRLIGIVLVLGGQVLAVVEMHRAWRRRMDPEVRDGPFWLFLLRRRVRREELTAAGWQHWCRAGWIAPAGWVLGGGLVSTSL